MKLVINIILVEPFASFFDGIAVFYAVKLIHRIAWVSGDSAMIPKTNGVGGVTENKFFGRSKKTEDSRPRL